MIAIITHPYTWPVTKTAANSAERFPLFYAFLYIGVALVVIIVMIEFLSQREEDDSIVAIVSVPSGIVWPATLLFFLAYLLAKAIRKMRGK